TYETISVINLEFPFNTDMDEVERKVDSLISDSDLPDEVTTDISRTSFGALPIFNISLFAKDNADLQSLLEDDVIPELKKIEGVNSVSVGGLKEELLQITIDKDKAAENGLSLTDIKDQINEKDLSFPAGNLDGDNIQVPVRVQEKVDTINQLKEIVLTSKVNPQAPPTSLGDIAKIEEVTDRPEITRYNMEDSFSMAITKKQDANTVEVADQVLDVMKDYKDDFSYAIGFDSADGIKKSVETLVKEGLLGAVFASLAVLLFLRNIRATIIAIISIPLSLLV
ncbi:efflux RND transporter permease subunit, partial [Rossellomorea marisflavi]